MYLVNITYRAKISSTSKMIGLLIVLIGLLLMWIFAIVFRRYIINIFQLKLDILSCIITGGFSFLFILIFLMSRIFFIAGEYVLTDNELIIRTPWVTKYAEQKIPYSDIENVFLYVSWDLRGHERYLILVKRYGKLDVNIMYPTRGTLLFLNVNDYRRFVQDLASLAGIHITSKEAKVFKVDKVVDAEGKQFTSPLLTVVLMFILSLFIASPIILLAIHIIIEPVKVPLSMLRFNDLFMLSILISIVAIIFVPTILDIIQSYLLTREGLYIKKLFATIFIPRDIIKGFVYMDVNEKSGRGGGLLKIGDMVTIVSVKHFKEFLDAMKQYGYNLYYKPKGLTNTTDS